MLLGGIELGGTKIVYAVGNDNGEIIERKTIPTQEPAESLNLIKGYFKDKEIDALGIACFGPLDLKKESETYGYITTTPKKGWTDIDVLSFFKPLNIPLGFDTDVNGSCLGEVRFGAGKGFKNVLYGTIGTGIGFGIYLNGQLVHGLMHPETGHMLLNRHDSDLDFFGPCPFHENCLETLASGPSIEKRWNKAAEELYDNRKAWELEAYYLGQAICNCIMCYSPEKIILGGGVMHTPGLIELIRKETVNNLNGYIKKKEILEDIDNYIVLPELGDDSGILGAFELGRLELKR